MDPRRSIRNGFANGGPHSHFYAACTSRHESSMIPKALKIATRENKNAPIPPQVSRCRFRLKHNAFSLKCCVECLNSRSLRKSDLWTSGVSSQFLI